MREFPRRFGTWLYDHLYWRWEAARHKGFLLLQRLGLSLVPNHFYSPVPDVAGLSDHLWSDAPFKALRSSSVFCDSAFVEKARLFRETYLGEYQEFSKARSADGFFLFNGQFQAVDAEVLYSFIRLLKPKRILEVGSGYSTLVMVEAAKRNPPCEIICVEPYPRTFLPKLSIRLIENPVQEVDDKIYDQLDRQDILSIDSSHMIKTGSDAVHLYLNIFPRLKPGVVIHIHDIFLPYEYPKAWLKEYDRFWNEQYFVGVILAFSDKFRVLWASYLMHREYSGVLRNCFPSYPQAAYLHGPSSLWLEKLG